MPKPRIYLQNDNARAEKKRREQENNRQLHQQLVGLSRLLPREASPSFITTILALTFCAALAQAALSAKRDLNTEALQIGGGSPSPVKNPWQSSHSLATHALRQDISPVPAPLPTTTQDYYEFATALQNLDINFFRRALTMHRMDIDERLSEAGDITLLEAGIKLQSMHLIELALQFKADVNVVTEEMTPLFLAVEHYPHAIPILALRANTKHTYKDLNLMQYAMYKNPDALPMLKAAKIINPDNLVQPYEDLYSPYINALRVPSKHILVKVIETKLIPLA